MGSLNEKYSPKRCSQRTTDAAAILFMLPFRSTSQTGKYIISEIFINNFYKLINQAL